MTRAVGFAYAPAAMELAPGTVFAGYTIVAPLNSGGMGAVYEAVQQSTGEHRAIKLMHPQFAKDPEMRARFKREAQVVARIKSDHVARVIDYNVDPATGAPFIVMELLHGSPLSTIVDLGLALSREVVCSIVEQVGDAVSAMHSANVIHRDLKPENIFLAKSRSVGGPPSVVKVLDFGITKDVAVNSPTIPAGSPLWMAPEQHSFGVITLTVDVWALGLIAFALLTGRLFWLAAQERRWTIEALANEIQLAAIPSATSRAAVFNVDHLLPAGFDVWFAACVARDPKARYSDVSTAVMDFACMLPKGKSPAHVPVRVPTPPARNVGSWTWAVTGAAAATVASVAVALAWPRGRQPTTASPASISSSVLALTPGSGSVMANPIASSPAPVLPVPPEAAPSASTPPNGPGLQWAKKLVEAANSQNPQGFNSPGEAEAACARFKARLPTVTEFKTKVDTDKTFANQWKGRAMFAAELLPVCWNYGNFLTGNSCGYPFFALCVKDQ